MTIRLFLLEPDTIFAARVNQASFTYPLTSVEFDGVTTGAFGDILPGMTVLFGSTAGADDYGRQRVRLAADSDTIFIGRSSEGTRDGEVDLVDNAYISVLNDFRIWAKIPYIDDADESFKDEIDWTDETVEPPPVANAGAAVFATIAAGIITVDFDAGDSFVVADGAAIATYAWDVDDGSITVGTAASQAITATFPAGFRWISLKVTDDNGKSHTARAPVFARNSASGSDKTISIFEITQHRITQDGQDVSVRIREDIAESTYPDGTLCMIADGEPSTAADRSNLLCVGWHWTDPATISAKRTGVLRDTVFNILDVAGRLGKLPTFGEEVIYKATPDAWDNMTTPNIDKFMHYMFQWHSTALDLADWTPSGTGSTMATAIYETAAGTLWDAIARKAPYIVPDYRLTCNTLGQLQTVVDPFLQDSGDRTATIQATLTEDDWADIKYTHQHFPHLHWLRGGAVVAGTTDPENLPTVFGISPGPTPSQGANESQHYEQLAVNQAAINKSTGHRYARMNAPETPFRIELAEGSDKGIEPADMTWVRLTISSDTAAQRGLAFTEERGLPLEVNINYNHARTGIVRKVTLVWERETVGIPAVTYVPFEDGNKPDDDNWWDSTYVDPVEDDTDIFTNPPKAYLLYDEDEILLTLDILAGSPTWTNVTGTVTGTILVCQYVAHSNNALVGIWCLSSAGVWWCDDIFAGTPAWTNTLSLATMQVAEAAPDSGSSRFISMVNHGLRPGAAHVFTMPDAGDATNYDWDHAYSWSTTDFGDNWTLCDSADEFVYDDGTRTRGYAFMTIDSCEWYRDAGANGKGRIYARRMAGRYGTGHDAGIVYSDDDGDTWTLGAQVKWATNEYDMSGLLHPFPDTDDPLFIVGGPTGANLRAKLWKSTDNGATISDLGIPTNYEGFEMGWRVNQKYNTPLHVLAWARLDADNYSNLIESDDGGSTWSLVYNPGTAWGTGRNHYGTPNGWPGDDDIWFLVLRGSNNILWAKPTIYSTEDYFSSIDDRTGDMETKHGGSWEEGAAADAYVPGGFALPKIGVNA